MKPYILTLQAFGPFESQTTVDFTQFGNSLFLISGKTGSGKSTIFDALMYALFGETSGKERKPKDMRTQNVDAKIKTIVNLDFEHNGYMYRIERTISGRKSLTEHAMIRYPDGKIVEKSGAVTTEIINLLGIEAEQFRMIAMLPQGQFRELLAAKSEKKSDILKKLFDTRIYSLLQNKLKEHDEQLKNEHVSFEQDIKRYITFLKAPDDNPAYTWLADFIRNPIVAENNLEILFSDLQKLGDDDAAQIHRINEQLQTVRTELTRISEEKGKAESNNMLLARAATAREKYECLLPNKEQYTVLKTAIMRAHAAETVSAAETLYLNAIDVRSGLETTIAENTKWIAENEPILKNIDEKLAALTENPEWKQQQETHDKLKSALDTYRKLTDCESEKATLSQSITASMELAASIDSDSIAIIEQIHTYEEREKELGTADVELAETVTQLRDLAKKQDTITELGTVFEELNSLDTTLQNRQEECRRAKEAYQTLQTLADKQQQLYLDGQAGILADTLEDNEPCPVCGSCSHPSPAIRSDTIPDRTAVTKAQNNAENARTLWTNKTTEAAECRTARSAKEEELRKAAGEFVTTDGSINEIVTLLTTYTQTLQTEEETLLIKKQEIMKNVAEKNKIAKAMPKLRADHEANLKKKSEAEQKYSADTGRMEALDRTIADLTKTLPYPTQQEAETAYENLSRKLEMHETELSHLRTRKEDIQKIVNQSTGIILNTQPQLNPARQKEAEALAAYQRARESNGFANIDEYREALQSVHEVIPEEKKVNAFFNDLDKAETELHIAEETCRGHVYIELEKLTDIHAEREAEEKKLQNELDRYRQRQENNHENTDRISKIWNQKKSGTELYTAIHKLSETANGTIIGQERLDLERYIQAVYFSEILQFANKQLLTMSANRYELSRPKTGVSLQGKSGLELVVIDRFTGKTRDITTLSGGESFLASLALALGLSEMIQQLSGGISIDALFVDEGFDTLDTDALQDVLKVLWTLTTGNRVVGIISHRGELRDQLDRKIIVTKLGNGRSRIEPKY